MWKVLTNSNLNPLLKLFFYLLILANNNLLLSAHLDSTESDVCIFLFCVFLFLFLFFCMRNWRQRLLFMYCAWAVAENFDFSAIFSTSVSPCSVHGTHKLHFSATFSLKMGPMTLFTHLKIISLQCFQFQQK